MPAELILQERRSLNRLGVYLWASMQQDTVRAIAHFDLDAFFVSVERLKDPSLEGRPLIVGGLSGRGVVAACSYETRAFGVHSAMPMVHALKLCPGAVVVPPRHGDYGDFSRRVTEMIAREAPRYEKASIDEFYLDLTGMGTHETIFAWASGLRERIIRETGLPISFALSLNKLVSKVATDTVKPNGRVHVPPGTEKAFLAPLAVEKMPGIGPETAQWLHRVGIFTLGQLAASSKDTLSTLFGRQGLVLWRRANGIDDSEISMDREQKSLSSETTFDEDIREKSILEKTLLKLNAENGRELRRIRRFCSCVAIKIRYADFETITRQQTIPATASSHKLFTAARQLLDRFYTGQKAVRLLGIRYSQLIEGGQQLDLFDNEDTQVKLYKTIDELNQRFGPGSIFPATSLD